MVRQPSKLQRTTAGASVSMRSVLPGGIARTLLLKRQMTWRDVTFSTRYR
jgi:hypothetical protein